MYVAYLCRGCKTLKPGETGAVLGQCTGSWLRVLARSLHALLADDQRRTICISDKRMPTSGLAYPGIAFRTRKKGGQWTLALKLRHLCPPMH